jgi:uncharacterized protein YndB with AHSA1/START domain
MRWLAFLGIVVVAVALLIIAIGLMLPRDHTATRTADTSVPPDTVWAVITDVASYPRWRPDVKRVEILPPVDGRPSWREIRRNDSIPYETVASVPPTRFVTRIADPTLPFGGEWSIELAPIPTGARVTITERGQIHNLLYRVVSHFVLGYTTTMDAYLHALQRRLETPARPDAAAPQPPPSQPPAPQPPAPGAPGTPPAST